MTTPNEANEANDAVAAATPPAETEVIAPAAEAPAAAETSDSQDEPAQDDNDGEDSELKELELQLSDLLGVLRQIERWREDRPAPDDPEFVPMRDNDRILAAGTVVLIGGVKCTLLVPSPILAPEFANEQHFAELIADDSSNLSLNLPYLRNRYNRNGQVLGANEQHPEVALDRAIEQKQLQIQKLLEADAANEADKAE